MDKLHRDILAAGLTLCFAAAAAGAPKPAKPTPYPGDVASQLQLKADLFEALGKQSLAQTLAHVREEWEQLTPDQRQRHRDTVRAFLRNSPGEQEQILRNYERLIRMSAADREAYQRRGRWLKAVVDWLKANDPQRVEQLQKMRPLERGKALIELRDRLVREKRIALPRAGATPAPTTRPAAPGAPPAASGSPNR